MMEKRDVKNLANCMKRKCKECRRYNECFKKENEKVNNTFFSVIIPNYNSEKWIDKCLNSILEQTYKNYEIIFVDDMSTDSSLQKAIDIIGNKQPTTFIKNTTKRLNGGSRNVGIVEATGDYIIFIDCDDWFKDNKVFETINESLCDEDILFVGYDYYNGNTSSQIPKYKNIEEAIKDVTCAPWTKVVKTKILKKTLFPEGTLFEDRIQHYRLLMKCRTYNNLGKVIYVWNRVHKDSISERKDYIDYRFNYCGELYRFIKEIDNEEFKGYLKNELKGYLKSCNEMVGELDG